MNRLFIIIIISVITYSASGQTDTISVENFKIKDSTEIGMPDGTPMSKVIGISGGTLTSEDGRVQLIFPEGALSKELKIEIQPIKNHAQNGVGKAYWFEPSGTHFHKPVTIIFKYSDEELEQTHPELMSFATQDKTGKWRRFEFDEVDTINKTLAGSIYHFSGVSRLSDMIIEAQESTIRAAKGTFVVINDVSRWYNENTHDFFNLPKQYRIEVYVNGVLNGDETTGKLLGAGGVYIYTAPKILPPRNPVVIEAMIFKAPKKRKKGQRDDLNIKGYSKCKIEVYNVYKVKVETEFTGREGMGSKIIDSAVFYVGVFPYHAVIENITNYDPIVLNNGRKAGILEENFAEGSQGVIHLSKKMKYQLVKKTYPYEVFLEFDQIYVTIIRFQYRIRSLKTNKETHFDYSWPIQVIFPATNEPYSVVMRPTKDKYKVTVIPWE